MRLLTILGVLQTACLLFLVFKLSGNHAPDSYVATTTDDPMAQSVVSSRSTGTHESIDDARLRRIIREELAAQTHQAPTVGQAAAVKARNFAEDQLRRAHVARQLDQYKRIGAISQVQMEDLQQEIARLDPVSRKAALAQLMRAMNSGQINGRL